MDREIRLFIYCGIVVLLGIIAIYFFLKSSKKEQAITSEIKLKYEKAIKDGNKVLALTLGRQYYSRLRGGKLSIYDEQAITNDLSTINNYFQNQ